MNIDLITEENIFYTQIFCGKLNIEKLIVAKDKKDVESVVNDYFESFDLFLSFSLKMMKDLLEKSKEEGKKVVLSYFIKNHEDEIKIEEKISFVDDIENYKAEIKDKEVVFFSNEFLIALIKKVEQETFLDNAIYSDSFEEAK